MILNLLIMINGNSRPIPRRIYGSYVCVLSSLLLAVAGYGTVGIIIGGINADYGILSVIRAGV